MSYIRDIIEKLHFDKDNCLITDQKKFEENLSILLDDDTVYKITAELSSDKENIATLVNVFNHHRYTLCKENNKEENKIKNCLNELMQHGISKINLFNEEDLAELTKFQAHAEQQMGDDVKFAGYVGGHFDPSGARVYNAKSNDNDGQLRMQSKNLSFEIPGIKPLINNKELKKIFSRWYNVGEGEIIFARQNLEWINPAPINHNKWHLDTLRDQLKVMILLNDVDYDTAPMFYAKGSHDCTNEPEKEKKHALFIHGTKILENKIKHEGYFSDLDVNNYTPQITDKSNKIKIKDNDYDNFICTGIPGDCLLFESSGFHSGNRSGGKVRKSIVLTTPPNYSYKNKFLDYIGKVNC